MSRTATLKPDHRGLYYRQIGYDADKRQPRFYFGREPRAASLAHARIEQLWEAIKDKAKRDGIAPVWSEATLALGRAFAGGDRVFLRDGGILSEVRTAAELEAALDCPVRKFTADDNPWLRAEAEANEATTKRILAGLTEKADALNRIVAQAHADAGVTLKTGTTTLQALNLYREWVKGNPEYQAGGTLTQHARGMLRKLDFITRHLPDIDLADFGTEAWEMLAGTIASRPPAMTTKKKGGQPIAGITATKTVGLARHMVKFWHRSKSIPWRMPDDMDLSRAVRVKATHEERLRMASPVRLPRYTVEELVTLWQYATSRERLLIVLALNCGMGAGELGHLRRDEIHLRKTHPHARFIDIYSNDEDSWIFAVRNKTGKYGEWQLWPVTVAALEWWEKHRPDSPRPELLVTQSGQTYYRQTKGGNACQDLANAWGKLLDRVKKDKPDFRRLSFNRLRKTGPTILRGLADESMGKLYTFHGDICNMDANLTRYADTPWRRLFCALRELRDTLKPVWDSVAEPFADAGLKQGGANISAGKIARIQELAGKGWATGKIAADVGVTTETVRRWVKRG